MPRLLHVTTTDMSLSLLLGPQLRAFAGAGYEVIGASAPGPYVAEIEGWGVRHVPLRHATRAVAPHHDILALRELGSLCRTLRPDIVHTHNPKPGFYGRLAARWAGVPAVVNTVHGLYALPTDRWPKRAAVYGAERVAGMCSHAELVQNPEDVEVLRRLGVPGPKLQCLGNGIDLARFTPGRIAPGERAALRREMGAGPDDIVCGLVGRLVAEKGYREAFTAARTLRGRNPTVRLVVVGPPDLDKSDGLAADEIERAGHEGSVRFLGARHDVERLYECFDIFMLASHREGFPRSAMEAAAMGLPVVATDIRGCRQVVDHGLTGLLVAPRSPEGLAGAVARLAADPALRRRMGAGGQAKARAEFDQQKVIELTLGTYERLLARSGRPVGAAG